MDNRKVVGQYLLGSKIGSGFFGDVRRCTDLVTGKDCCIKVMGKERNNLPNVENEIKILETLRKIEGNWVKILKVTETCEAHYIVMEVGKGGDLFSSITSKRKMSELRTKEIFYDILEGLEGIHAQNIIHRDLKPENVLLTTKTTSARAILADFGLATFWDGPGSIEALACGTPIFMAPEVCAKLDYGPKADIWSFGMLAHAMICKQTLMHGKRNAIFARITALKPGWYRKSYGLTPEAFVFIASCLRINSGRRPTAADLLNHPFLSAVKRKRERAALVKKFTNPSPHLPYLSCLVPTRVIDTNENGIGNHKAFLRRQPRGNPTVSQEPPFQISRPVRVPCRGPEDDSNGGVPLAHELALPTPPKSQIPALPGLTADGGSVTPSSQSGDGQDMWSLEARRTSNLAASPKDDILVAEEQAVGNTPSTTFEDMWIAEALRKQDHSDHLAPLGDDSRGMRGMMEHTVTAKALDVTKGGRRKRSAYTTLLATQSLTRSSS